MRIVRIGTRSSHLAMSQARWVADSLRQCLSGFEYELVGIKSKADKEPDMPISEIGSEGVFVKELQESLLAGDIDIAVHSMKDLPLESVKGAVIAAVPVRMDATDALVSSSGKNIDELPLHSRVATSSIRRQSQLRMRRKDLEIVEMRGNLDTRLKKLDSDYCDAVVVASCGLIRLGLASRISQRLDMAWMLPQPGQGAIAIEVCSDNMEILEKASPLDDPSSRACVEAEREFLRSLGGGCRSAIAAYASSSSDMLDITGSVIALDGSVQVRDTASGLIAEPAKVGRQLANRLIERGAEELL